LVEATASSDLKRLPMALKRRVVSATRPPPANHLLAALPADDYARLAPALRNTPLKLKHFLQKPGDALDQVYFPGGGFVSVVTVLKDGAMVEVVTIGREGMLGIAAAVVDGDPSPGAAMVQAESDVCYTMSAEAFRVEMERRGPFYELVTRYSQALVGFIMQSTACNAVHSVEQRLSRWLLLAHDRIGRDDFPLTQEFAAMMLGTSRPTVTVVAGTLQKAGFIKYHRGHVTIVDRGRLEAASCECYQTATNLLRAVTGRRS
jgi:CRP-like cAMP-binding protein